MLAGFAVGLGIRILSGQGGAGCGGVLSLGLVE